MIVIMNIISFLIIMLEGYFLMLKLTDPGMESTIFLIIYAICGIFLIIFNICSHIDLKKSKRKEYISDYIFSLIISLILIPIISILLTLIIKIIYSLINFFFHGEGALVLLFILLGLLSIPTIIIFII